MVFGVGSLLTILDLISDDHVIRHAAILSGKHEIL